MGLSVMWAIDLTHTAHTVARTGIQQVCLALHAALADHGRAAAVVYDRYARAWRPPDMRERAMLAAAPDRAPGRRRAPAWSACQVWRGRWRRLFPGTAPALPRDGIFCPELFDRWRDTALFGEPWPGRLPKVALFHDAVPLRFPEWTPAATVARFPAYLQALSRFDRVVCVSASSARDLHEAWETLGIRARAAARVVRLGVVHPSDRAVAAARPQARPNRPVVLMVGTLEARKNHLALLEACAALWRGGLDFELRLAGMLNRETGQPAADRIAALARAGRPVTWEGPVSDRRLGELYRAADVFAYPSRYEGFGIPVLEALAHGLPALITPHGALGELADGGGCVVCDGSAAGIRDALGALLRDPDRRAALAHAAAARPVRTLRDTAAELGALFQELGARPSS